MAVKYLSGLRLTGTEAERLALSGTTPDAVPQTSWKQLGKTTLGDDGTLTVSGFTAKDNLMVLGMYKSVSGNVTAGLKFNSNTDGEYASVSCLNGSSTEQLDTSGDCIQLDKNYGGSEWSFFITTIKNTLNQEKLCKSENNPNSDTGAGTAPNRIEAVGKWDNTDEQITTIQLTDKDGSTSQQWADGSEVVVLGMDDDEADSGTNFWQELANPTDLAVAGDTLDSGTFTAKDYLMVDVFRTRSSSVNSRIRVNGDDGEVYSHRNYGASNSYGNDSTTEDSTSIHSHALTTNDSFTTYLIVNKLSKEKLMIIHEINRNSTGNNVPARMEVVAKWANTNSAITSINVINTDSGNLDVGTSIRVWGGTPT